MQAPATNQPVPYLRWLPYWAVFEADVHTTLRNWVFRCWVVLSGLTAAGYLLYRYGLVREVGIVQPASLLVSDLLRWAVLASTSLIAVLTAGTISSERGSLADSVLSRGISRHQYFLGKWHARLMTLLGAYLILGLLSLAGSQFLLHEDLSVEGCGLALATVSALLAVIITCGVTVSAICNNTVLGITVLWMLLYGGGFVLSLVPLPFPSPDRVLQRLPFIVRGQYDFFALGKLIGCAVLVSLLTACFGSIYFARRDV